MSQVAHAATREVAEGVKESDTQPSAVLGNDETEIVIGRAFEAMIAPRVAADRATAELWLRGRSFGNDWMVIQIKGGADVRDITKDDVIDALLDACMRSIEYRPVG